MSKKNEVSSVQNWTILCDGMNEDYISKLPESIIGHVLSRLPTKDAIKTCVLSKDWEYKWTNIYDFTIDDLEQRRNRKAYVFVKFMESLARTSLSYNVRSFYIFLHDEYELSQITAWISPILGPNLETLMLRSIQEGFEIPQTLLNCSSLKKLTLMCKFIFRVPIFYTFPSLGYLDLCRVAIVNENYNSDTFVLKFPVLKTLKLRESQWVNVNSVEIYAPTLQTFISFSHTKFNALLYDYSIKIIGARISEFEVTGLQDRFVLTRSTVDCATLSIWSALQRFADYGLQIQRLFEELSTMKHLILSGPMLNDLLKECKIGLPQYDKLERIEIYDGVYTNLLLEFLHAAPYLKFLEIDVSNLDDYDYNKVECVPHCITYSLEEVNFAISHYHYRSKPKYELKRFILKFGACLKTIRLSHWYTIVNDGILTLLPTFPQASSYLSIVADQRV